MCEGKFWPAYPTYRKRVALNNAAGLQITMTNLHKSSAIIAYNTRLNAVLKEEPNEVKTSIIHQKKGLPYSLDMPFSKTTQ
jgi:hypothetical protein